MPIPGSKDERLAAASRAKLYRCNHTIGNPLDGDEARCSDVNEKLADVDISGFEQ